ncbi:hypothetical protein [Photorhabdus temperata]|uniref:hypothetical protein n=1 Tax=Photorhabdus temperata TaxID=574560 RepID=UPI00038A4EEF|nr:hypothetical protein [Photorhabdus temperata]EQB98433.1 hypothetical protein B738_24800 [Photorhabdus temperata subsp. temperata M1021]
MQGNGLYNPYKLNRPLTRGERYAQLCQGKPTQITAKYGLYIVDHDTVIRMNSTYMETVDKYYREQGFVSSLNATVFCCFLGMALYFTGKTIYLSILNGAIKENTLLGFMIMIPATVFFFVFQWQTYFKRVVC